MKWPRYVILQRQRKVLSQRLKVPPTVNQFKNTLEKNQAAELFRLLAKYAPETAAEKKARLAAKAKAEAEGKPVDQKKLNAHAWMNWFDILLFICLAYMLWYVVGQNARLLDFVSVQPVYGIDYIFMVMTIVLLLIAVYRTLGIVLTIVYIMLMKRATSKKYASQA